MANTLPELAKDLEDHARDMDDKVARVVARSARRIQQDWKDNARAQQRTPTRIPHIPDSVTYEIHRAPAHTIAIIEPNDRLGHPVGEQAKISHILEFGWEYGGVKSPPQMNAYRAMVAEIPRLFEEMADAAEIRL